eukprot:SAG31_NODE_672_length_12933_cov_3.746143_3_plen_42_part_00
MLDCTAKLEHLVRVEQQQRKPNLGKSCVHIRLVIFSANWFV